MRWPFDRSYVVSVAIAALAGFFAQPFIAHRIESGRTSELRNEVQRLTERLEASEARVRVADKQTREVQAKLDEILVKLEKNTLSSETADQFDYELVCGDYAEEVAQERFDSEADLYCESKNN